MVSLNIVSFPPQPLLVSRSSHGIGSYLTRPGKQVSRVPDVSRQEQNEKNEGAQNEKDQMGTHYEGLNSLGLAMLLDLQE